MKKVLKFKDLRLNRFYKIFPIVRGFENTIYRKRYGGHIEYFFDIDKYGGIRWGSTRVRSFLEGTTFVDVTRQGKRKLFGIKK